MGNLNRIRYRGYYWDAETGLYYLQSRYYDPVTCRFINAGGRLSGIGGDDQGYNLFTYCMNNPVNMNDSTGNWPKWITNAVNAITNAVKKAASTVVNAVKSVISSVSKSNVVTARLPKNGDPTSSKTLPYSDGTPKQKRWYGPDGNAEKDRDYNHSGNMPFPHDHEWRSGIRGKDHLPPSPDYEFSWKPVVGIGIVTICAIGIAIVVANDTTGIGVVDDFLLGPLGAGLKGGLIMIFG